MSTLMAFIAWIVMSLGLPAEDWTCTGTVQAPPAHRQAKAGTTNFACDEGSGSQIYNGI